jgi:hypothetical protein
MVKEKIHDYRARHEAEAHQVPKAPALVQLVITAHWHTSPALFVHVYSLSHAFHLRAQDSSDGEESLDDLEQMVHGMDVAEEPSSSVPIVVPLSGVAYTPHPTPHLD